LLRASPVRPPATTSPPAPSRSPGAASATPGRCCRSPEMGSGGSAFRLPASMPAARCR